VKFYFKVNGYVLPLRIFIYYASLMFRSGGSSFDQSSKPLNLAAYLAILFFSFVSSIVNATSSLVNILSN
jgi:hypothetical protein